jgi:DNA-binding NarL/FixJ family response regulator
MKSFLIADDHAVVRQGLSLILNDMYNNPIIYQVGMLDEILEVIQVQIIDVLILDIAFPEGDSIHVVQEAKKIQPNLKVLVFSAYDEEIYALRYLNRGADGYLSKLSPDDVIRTAITSIVREGKYVSDKTKEKAFLSYVKGESLNELEQLSNKEIEIARLLIKGYGNLEISNILGIQKSTVSTYKSRIFEKLSIDNVVDLLQIFKSNNY